MRVDLNEWVETEKVSDLKPGDTFKWSGSNDLYMRVPWVLSYDDSDIVFNVLNLDNNEFKSMNEDIEVEVINCKVVEDDGVDGKCV